MLSNAVILSVLASTAAANLGNGAADIANIAKSHDSVDANNRADAACVSAASSLVAGIPLPTGSLLTWMASYAATATQTVSDACDPSAPTDMPESLNSAYSSYYTAASSWFVASSDDIASASSACSDEPEIASIGPLSEQMQSCITKSGEPVTQTSEVVVATTSGSSTFSVTVPTTTVSTPTGQVDVPAAAPETPRAFGAVMLAAGVALGGAAFL